MCGQFLLNWRNEKGLGKARYRQLDVIVPTSFSQFSTVQKHGNMVKVHQGAAHTHLPKWGVAIRQLQFTVTFQAQVG